MEALINPEQLDEALNTLSGWAYNAPNIGKNYVFRNFKEAMAFILYVALHAEQADHHPEIWNVYNKVKISLHTHDAGGITQKDIQLAQKIESYFNG